MADLVEVYRDPRSEFARLIMIGLQQQGIRATLVGEHLSNLIGAGLAATPARVLVPDHELDDARAVLAVLMADHAREEPNTEGQPTTCPACDAAWEPGFTVCWQCETPL